MVRGGVCESVIGGRKFMLVVGDNIVVALVLSVISSWVG